MKPATLCPKCGKRGKALSYCKLCGEFIPITISLPPKVTASEAQLLIDQHTIALIDRVCAMKLTQFTAEVNKLARAYCEGLNRNKKLARAARLFGAVHYDYPESMMKHYFDKGQTPQQAHDEIKREVGI